MSEITVDKMVKLIDGEYKGAHFWTTCPFHDDTHASLKIFPTTDRASYCWACAKYAWWDEVLAAKLNISIAEAKQKLGDTRPVERTKEEGQRVIYHNFCDEYSEYDLSWQFSNTKPLPEHARDWLQRKGILENALRLQWRWVEGDIRGWTKGIVIPYFEDNTVAYIRFRRQEQMGKFSKPIGPKGISPRPYYIWGDYSDVVYVCEGESDAASLTQRNVSVIGIPGATQMQCINSAIAEANNRGFKNLVVVGDNDEAGQKFVERVKRAVLYLSDMKTTTLNIPAEFNDANDMKVANKLFITAGFKDRSIKESAIELVTRIFGNDIKRVVVPKGVFD